MPVAPALTAPTNADESVESGTLHAGTGFFLGTFRVVLVGLLLLALAFGGPAVKFTALAALIFVWIPTRGGLIGMTARLAGLLIGVALLPIVGTPLSQVLALPFGGLVGLGLATVIVLGAPTALGGWLGRRLTAPWQKHRYLYVFNRAGGLLGRVGEAVLLVCVLLWTFALFSSTLRLTAERFRHVAPGIASAAYYAHTLGHLMLHSDPFGRWVADRNPLAAVPRIRTFAIISEATADRAAFWDAVAAGVFDELLAHPVVARHIEAFRADDRLRRAVKLRDLGTLLTSRAFGDAVQDDELCDVIAAHWPDLRARVSDAQVAEVQRLARELDAATAAELEEVERQARERGITLP